MESSTPRARIRCHGCAAVQQQFEQYPGTLKRVYRQGRPHLSQSRVVSQLGVYRLGGGYSRVGVSVWVAGKVGW